MPGCPLVRSCLSVQYQPFLLCAKAMSALIKIARVSSALAVSSNLLHFSAVDTDFVKGPFMFYFNTRFRIQISAHVRQANRCLIPHNIHLLFFLSKQGRFLPAIGYPSATDLPPPVLVFPNRHNLRSSGCQEI